MDDQMLFVTFQIGVGMPVDSSLSQADNVRLAVEVANREFAEGVEVGQDDIIKVEFDNMGDISQIFPESPFRVIEGGKK